MKNIIKTKKGFTLVELVIVIVIVGILSVISVPIYRGYVEKAMITEGKVLIGAIGKAELAYHVEHGYFLNTGWTSMDSRLDIDVRGNKYFRQFYASSGSRSYYPRAMVVSSSVDKSVYVDDNECVDIYVHGWNNNAEWTLHATQWANGGLHGEGDDIDVWSGGLAE